MGEKSLRTLPQFGSVLTPFWPRNVVNTGCKTQQINPLKTTCERRARILKIPSYPSDPAFRDGLVVIVGPVRPKWSPRWRRRRRKSASPRARCPSAKCRSPAPSSWSRRRRRPRSSTRYRQSDQICLIQRLLYKVSCCQSPKLTGKSKIGQYWSKLISFGGITYLPCFTASHTIRQSAQQYHTLKKN